MAEIIRDLLAPHDPGSPAILAPDHARLVRAGRALDHETEDAFERLRVAGYL